MPSKRQRFEGQIETWHGPIPKGGSHYVRLPDSAPNSGPATVFYNVDAVMVPVDRGLIGRQLAVPHEPEWGRIHHVEIHKDRSATIWNEGGRSHACGIDEFVPVWPDDGAPG